MLIAVALMAGFASAGGAVQGPTPDPRWAALATQQQLAFLGPSATATVAMAALSPPSRRAAPTPSPTATPTPPATAMPTVTPAVAPTPTVAPVATATATAVATALTLTAPAPTPATAPMVVAGPADESIPEEPAPIATPPTPTSAPVLPALAVATVTAPALNLRAGPGLGFPVITSLTRGTTIELTGARQVADDYLWVEVVTAAGQRGWLLGGAVGVR
jgi:hypothetical protein